MEESEHFVQFYETDKFLLDSLSGFIGTGLREGDGCIVLATGAHLKELEDRLTFDGLDLEAAGAAGQYVSLEASGALSRFMIDGLPEPARFGEFVGPLLAQALEGRRRVRVFGEMVMLLWSEGNQEAAFRLEKLWNDLHRTRPFQLFCAYPLNGFDTAGHAEPLQGVCSTHSRVIPAESYTALISPEDRLRAIIQLQQQARLLQAEVCERKEAERALRGVTEALEVQVEDLRRLHEMSVGLTSTLDVAEVLEEVLRAAMAVQGTEMGLLSLCEAGRDGLTLKVHSGFDEAFLKEMNFIPPGAGSCGTCYEQRRRVVVEDVDRDPVFDAYREAAQRAGVRACHSTPLISRRGHIIGVLSVHFRHPRRPQERELRLMDLYAQMAADIIENAQLHQQVQQKLEEREQLLAREQLARAEAESANRLKDEFLATASHELRTPLTAIIGWSHMLQEGKPDEATLAHGLETIERNAKAQAQLVEDILDVSRVITGKLRLSVGSVDMAAVINAAIDAVQLAADSKCIQLAVTLDPSARHLSGDAGRLQQVIWNLLSNAIKFTPKGGRIEVRLERAADRQVQIRVTDTGEGIAPEFLPFIFDRFSQGDPSSTRRHGGLGLGLAIVRHLVELHGGTVRADSPGCGHGSTFTIQLPLATPAERPKGRPPEVERSSAKETETRPERTQSLDGVRVLLVDDDQDTLNMLAVILSEYGAALHTASTAAAALEVLRWYEPDVLVSDLAMPDEDGYSLINKVRALEAKGSRQIPAVALTAYVRVEDRARALSAGFNMFVPKPVEPAELITSILSLVEPVTTKCS
ncbi:MAG TPA: ATP-binding protein [Pyrinomonadaceae bacterium]|jgi:signal transduction histidine kinase/ActR/RegA family two-component response regulator